MTTFKTLIEDSFSGCKQSIQIQDELVEIYQERGIRQGDTLSPKLFIAALEDAMKLLNWDERGVKINGVQVNHFRFADDFAIVGKSFEEVAEMLKELEKASLQVGLKINTDKTVVMSNIEGPHRIEIGGKPILTTNDFVYLGQTVSFQNNATAKEVQRRINLAWAAYGKLKDVLQGDFPQHMKAQVYNQCILPTMTYASETWPLTKEILREIAVCQRKMERSMLGVRLIDRVSNVELRRRSQVADAVRSILQLKHG